MFFQAVFLIFGTLLTDISYANPPKHRRIVLDDGRVYKVMLEEPAIFPIVQDQLAEVINLFSNQT